MPKMRVMDGVVFESFPTDDWRLSVHELGNGQREVVAQRIEGWRQFCMHVPLEPEKAARDLEDKKRANKLRAARRAKTRVRRSVKILALDTLMTLTYRANVTDLVECKAQFDLFLKRVRLLVPGFRYVACFERQARGAWHVHLATQRLPAELNRYGVKVKSFNVLRAAWRAVTPDGQGNVDVSARRGRVAQKSPGRMAAYLSKYLVKDWDNYPEGIRRWQGSRLGQVESCSVIFKAPTHCEVLELMYAFGADGECQVETMWLSPYRDVFYLSSGPPGPTVAARRRAVSTLGQP